jgi:hypothetical protein
MDDVNQDRANEITTQFDIFKAQDQLLQLQQNYNQSLTLNVKAIQLAKELESIKAKENKIIDLKAKWKEIIQLKHEKVTEALEKHCVLQAQSSSPECKALKMDEIAWRSNLPGPTNLREKVDESHDYDATKTV